MVDLPPGFRVVQQGNPRPSAPSVPAGFRVVEQPQQPAQNPEYTLPQPDPAGSWERGMLAPVEFNPITREFRPAVPQFLLDAWGAVTLPGDVYRGDVDPMSDEGMKRALDLSGMVTPGAPVGPRGVITPDGTSAPSQVSKALIRDGLTAQDVNLGISEMGPGGILADLGPSLQGLATGVARTPGEGQTDLMNYLRLRAAGARDRIQPQVDDILGPSLSTGQFSGNIKELKSATSPLYRAGFDNASPVDTAPIVRSIDSLLGQTVGTGKSRLQFIRSMFDDAGDDPRRLFSIRNEIDDMLDSPEIGRIAENLRDVRSAVDGELAAKVPGIKDADARWQEIARQNEGFNEGRKIFQQGVNAVDPRDLGPRMEQGAVPKGTMIGPSGESFALTQGGRNELDRLIGTGSQNRTNLASAIRGDGSWNRQKLVQLYGEEKADRLIRLFDNEARMAETERMATGSSITASAAASQKALEPASMTLPILEGPTVINPGNAAKRIAQAIFGNTAENAATKRNQEIAELLMSRGGWYENKMTSPEQLAVIRALLMSGDRGSNSDRSIK